MFGCGTSGSAVAVLVEPILSPASANAEIDNVEINNKVASVAANFGEREMVTGSLRVWVRLGAGSSGLRRKALVVEEFSQ